MTTLETLTLHESFFDVCAVIVISFTAQAAASSGNGGVEDGLGFVVSAEGAISAPWIGISPKKAEVEIVGSADMESSDGIALHMSYFGIYLDKYLSHQMGHAVGAVAGSVAPGIAITPSVSIAGSIAAETGVYNWFHKSAFDVCATITLPVCMVAGTIPQFTTEDLPVLIPEVDLTGSLDVNVLVALIGLMPTTEVHPLVDMTALYVVPGVKTVQFGTLVFQCAGRDGDDKITPIIDSKLAEAGISEPRAYTRTITISAETNTRIEHWTVLNLIGQRLLLSVYGIGFENAYISSVSDLHKRPKLNRFAYTIEFTHHVYGASDVISYGGITLSNPSRSAPDDISPTYAGNGSASYSLTNLVAKLEKTFTFECITEEPDEYADIISFIGTKQALIINGVTTENAYISALSSLQPRGGGDIYLYTIELSAIEGDVPMIVSFSGVSLPNASHTGDDIEILSSRTTLHSGKIAADIGTIPARSVSFSCMSNNKSDYDAIYAKIGTKAILYIDYVSGEWSTTIPKSYISELSGVRTCGSGTHRLYTWDISFEEETA